MKYLSLLVILVALASAQYIEAIIPVAVEPRHLLWNPAHNMVYCACTHDGRLAIIDGQTNNLETTLTVGDNTFYVYYGNAAASSVSDGGTTFEFFDGFKRASLTNLSSLY